MTETAESNQDHDFVDPTAGEHEIDPVEAASDALFEKMTSGELMARDVNAQFEDRFLPEEMSAVDRFRVLTDAAQRSRAVFADQELSAYSRGMRVLELIEDRAFTLSFDAVAEERGHLDVPAREAIVRLFPKETQPELDEALTMEKFDNWGIRDLRAQMQKNATGVGYEQRRNALKMFDTIVDSRLLGVVERRTDFSDEENTFNPKVALDMMSRSRGADATGLRDAAEAFVTHKVLEAAHTVRLSEDAVRGLKDHINRSQWKARDDFEKIVDERIVSIAQAADRIPFEQAQLMRRLISPGVLSSKLFDIIEPKVERPQGSDTGYDGSFFGGDRGFDAYFDELLRERLGQARQGQQRQRSSPREAPLSPEEMYGADVLEAVSAGRAAGMEDRRVYRQLIRNAHPDRNPDADPGAIRRITSAYDPKTNTFKF